MSRVLVLGGTIEARQLAARIPVLTSLAGRTSTPNLPSGEVRIGAFAGEADLAAWIEEQDARVLIDATHPFADRITGTAARAAARLGLPFAVLRRPGWTAGPGDRWHWVDSVQDAAHRTPDLGSRVFLTIGRTELRPFADVTAAWFLIRAIEQPDPPLPPRSEVVRAKGPFTVEAERELIRAHGIDLVVSKDSGGDSTSAKLVAARESGVPVLMVRRPPLPDVASITVLAGVDEAVRWVDGHPG